MFAIFAFSFPVSGFSFFFFFFSGGGGGGGLAERWCLSFHVRFCFCFFSILSSFPPPSPALSLLTFLLTCCAIRVGVVGDPGTTAVTGALTSARLAEVEVAR